MDFINKTVCVKQWQFFVMLLMTGFATGSILAELIRALGF